MAFIYALKDPRTNLVRYVGISSIEIRYRVNRHFKDARKGSRLPVHKWLRELEKLKLQPTVECLEETDDRLRECHWISSFRSAGVPLLNCTDGGDGGPRKPWSAETRAKILAAWTPEKREQKRLMMTGTKHTAEAKAKIGAAHKGKKQRPHTPEELEKMRIASLGRKLSPEARAKISAAKRGKKRPPMSDTQRRQISERMKGFRHTEASKEKCRLAKLGKKRPPLSQEWRDKIGAAGKGRIFSEEALVKIRANAKARAKLSPEDVRSIRSLYSSQTMKSVEIMRRFQCSKTTFYGIIHGERRADA